MFVVPITGDSVEIEGGVTSTVLSYSNYGKQGPAVYVEAQNKAAKAVPIAYTSIVAINGTPVELTPQKVFKSTGRIKRAMQLPQPGDKITSDGKVCTVKALKLAIRGDLSAGLVVVGEDINFQEKTEVSIRDITKITRANGGDLFTRATFLKLYKDYLGTKA